MKALFTVFISTALLCPVVCADDWPGGRPNDAASQAKQTAPQFQPAPPRPLRGKSASTRAAGFNDDFDGGGGVQRAQFSNDHSSGSSKRNDVDSTHYTPPQRSPLASPGDRNSGNSAGGSGNSAGFDLHVNGGDDLARSQDSHAPPARETWGNDTSFPTGTRRYVPPTDLGPRPGTPTATTPSLTMPPAPAITRTNPPPAAAPRRSLPPTVPQRDLRSAGPDDFRSNYDYDLDKTTTAYPDDPNRTMGTPRTTLPGTATAPTTRPPSPRRYDDSYRQAQVRPSAPTSEDRGLIVPPPDYPTGDLEKAASAAANTVERGARSVSNAIKNSAEHISEEGRRRGNSYFLTLLALFASVGLNLYLGWIAWDTYNRYQDLVSDLRYTGPRRSSESESTYGDSPVVEAAAY